MLRTLWPILLAGGALAVADARADIYKYVDAKGNIYFTDAPLRGDKYRLAWKRESRILESENRERLRSLVPQAPVERRSADTSTLAARRARYERLIAVYALRYALSPELLHAVIRAESAYDRDAVSSAGAQGLMQLMPATAARYGVKDSFNPVENVRGGAAYLRDLLDMFDQDVRLALAGYNAGENAVIRYGNRIPPYAETQDYVRIVLDYFGAEQARSTRLTAR